MTKFLYKCLYVFTLIVLLFIPQLILCFGKTPDTTKVTNVKIMIPDTPLTVDPMIYGQMLEDCNDKIIYGGVVDKNGKERVHVTKLLDPLKIPVMRWPGGTVIHEYIWEYGVGPLEKRPTVTVSNWGGFENHRFGTDEFLAWCKKLNIEPYINFNMSNHPVLGGSLREALNWVDYVNGSDTTIYGKKRIDNGYPNPYNVKYWCIGNENWGPFGAHDPETDTIYAKKLRLWASTIRARYPALKLLGVGYSWEWDNTILYECAPLIDFLTQHYYVTTKVNDNKIVDPYNSLFAPVAFEEHISGIAEILKPYNRNRMGNPIRLSIDEWNNRHSVFSNGKFTFDRHDPRRQFDVAIVAGMLNVFIRQSPVVGMANYIFPVNGHGLIRTVGENDAYITPIYHVFQQYRNWMVGNKLDVIIDGPGLKSSSLQPSTAGDNKENMDKILKGNNTLSFVDVSSVLSPNGNINISLTNRSSASNQKVKLQLPAKYVPSIKWELVSNDINKAALPESRGNIVPTISEIKKRGKELVIEIPPCGLVLIQCVKK